MSDDPHLDRLIAQLNHVESQVQFGDTKASLLFTADSILLAALGFFVSDGGAASDDLTAPTRGALVVAAAMLVVGLLLALWVVLPSHAFKPWVANRAAFPRPNPFFFVWIARTSEKETEDAIVNADPASLKIDAAHSIRGKSEVADFKFRMLWLAVAATMVSVTIATLAVAIELVSRI